MSRLGNEAKKTMVLSEIMNGKEKIDVDSLLGKKLTITGCDIIQLKNDRNEYQDVAVLTYAEDEKKFFFGGAVLTKIVKNWISICGDVDSVNDELKNDPVLICMNTGKTKDKKPITLVDILD